MGIEIDLGVEAAKLEDVRDAKVFLTGLWMNMSPKDPIRILVADSGRPTVRYPKKGAKLQRQTLVVAPYHYYAVNANVKACVKAIRLDPVAAALRGELYMQDFDEEKLETCGEGVVFLATYILWNVLRRYRLVPGRRGKSASARYAFGALRAFRATVQNLAVASGKA